ncbi:hypothetical protein TYRP_020195, partial [Tyrophagus putrescentiae]
MRYASHSGNLKPPCNAHQCPNRLPATIRCSLGVQFSVGNASANIPKAFQDKN